jgi:hypothetical protein
VKEFSYGPPHPWLGCNCNNEDFRCPDTSDRKERVETA